MAAGSHESLANPHVGRTLFGVARARLRGANIPKVVILSDDNSFLRASQRIAGTNGAELMQAGKSPLTGYLTDRLFAADDDTAAAFAWAQVCSCHVVPSAFEHSGEQSMVESAHQIGMSAAESVEWAVAQIDVAIVVDAGLIAALGQHSTQLVLRCRLIIAATAVGTSTATLVAGRGEQGGMEGTIRVAVEGGGENICQQLIVSRRYRDVPLFGDTEIVFRRSPRTGTPDPLRSGEGRAQQTCIDEKVEVVGGQCSADARRFGRNITTDRLVG